VFVGWARVCRTPIPDQSFVDFAAIANAAQQVATDLSGLVP
jgi:hypothetical protein